MFKKRIYIKNNTQPFKMSRTKIDLYFDCKRCFFIDQRFGIRRPHGTPLVINSRFVNQLKFELNECRKSQQAHPQIIDQNRKLIPYNHKKLTEWQNPFKGVSYLHQESNIIFYGVIDDIWLDKDTKKYHNIIIKTTSKKNKINYEEIWPGYWKQLSFYSYLLRKNSLDMSKTGALIFINALSQNTDSDHNINFDLSIFEKILDFTWIEPTIMDIFKILNEDKVPEISKKCKFCNYYINIRKKVDE